MLQQSCGRRFTQAGSDMPEARGCHWCVFLVLQVPLHLIMLSGNLGPLIFSSLRNRQFYTESSAECHRNMYLVSYSWLFELAQVWKMRTNPRKQLKGEKEAGKPLNRTMRENEHPTVPATS